MSFLENNQFQGGHSSSALCQGCIVNHFPLTACPVCVPIVGIRTCQSVWYFTVTCISLDVFKYIFVPDVLIVKVSAHCFAGTLSKLKWVEQDSEALMLRLVSSVSKKQHKPGNKVTLCESMCMSMHIHICLREIVCLRLHEVACTLTDNSEDMLWQRCYLLLVRTVLTHVLGVHELGEDEREIGSVVSSRWRRLSPNHSCCSTEDGGFLCRLELLAGPAYFLPTTITRRCAVLQLLPVCRSGRSHFHAHVLINSTEGNSTEAVDQKVSRSESQGLIVKKLSFWKCLVKWGSCDCTLCSCVS